MSLDLKTLQEDLLYWHKHYRPKRSQGLPYLFAHLHEEVSEAFREWRDKTKPSVSTDRYGLGKPEGLGAELADVVMDALTIAEACGIDLEDEILRKYTYREDKLGAKLRSSNFKKKKGRAR